MKFELSTEDVEKVNIWSKEQDSRSAELQDRKEPYYGCIGGVVTFSFTPTSLGMCIMVTHAVTKQ